MVPSLAAGSSSSWMLLRVRPLAWDTAVAMEAAGKVTEVFTGVGPYTSGTSLRFTLMRMVPDTTGCRCRGR